MTRMVNCVKLKREAEGLAAPPYPGQMGVRIWQSISKEAWEMWIQTQTRLVNENRLNLADARARKYLAQQMETFLFEDGDVEAQGYVPPPQ
ncbi:oxidative damage protection protein [Pusillimonas minor]|uniref:Probable Fe(2+)-trafficking protein n=1 Tax=Pusillimonas minor TaxID=2697024 RepID=A0A842HT74_9BURK|nr:oxidative damage protection protein [Pusillimonas minor]MBC2770848.1 oxidative damage protection protein [Pusillimonas minor]